MIETVGLTKRFGDTVAVEGLDLRIGRGQWFLYLGPNGAGKSTTLKMLVGLSEPTAGTARVGGLDPHREGPLVRRRVGYLPEDFEPFGYLTGREYLQFVGDLHGLDRGPRDRRGEELLDLLNLGEGADRPTREYSHGMRKKIGLAAALIHEPETLILDEPTAELDPRTSDLIRRVLRGLADRGACILMSTHILGAAEKQADQVGIIDAGRLVRCGSTDAILAEFPGETLEGVFLKLTGTADQSRVDAFLGRADGRRGDGDRDRNGNDGGDDARGGAA